MPMKLDNILVIADRDDSKQPAVRAALDLLPAAGCLRVVGFVYEHAAAEPGVLSATAAATLKDALLAAKRKWLDQSLAALQHDGNRLEVEAVWAGDIAEWVTEAVSRDGIDLVVKSGNRSETLFYTPLDWQLLRRCPAPVLITGTRLRKKGRRILAAVDAASTHSAQIELNRKVLAAAARLGVFLDAQVCPVHVIAVSAVAKDLDLIDTIALERDQRTKIGASLAALAGEYGIPAENIVIKLGQPDRVLPSLAARLKADLVVMGTVGRTGVAGRLLGNTAEQVLHRLRTSLLALRPG
ncbi:MAG: universal stress protein [Burkholderiales bacterium]|nr:universal stress protein [Burkholderiales bacterium]